MVLPKFQSSKITWILVILALWILSVVLILKFFNKIPAQIIENRKETRTEKIVNEESVVIDVVNKVSPLVVSIAVENRIAFNPFDLTHPGSKKEAGIGTGFVVSGDGLILTNKHVVDQQGSYIAIIKSNDGQERKLPIREIHRDPLNDLALVKVDASDLKSVEFGNSDSLRVGQMVIAIGNALGQFENTVTTGVVSGLGRGVTPIDPTSGVAEKLDDLIQTDAAINPGNSGGPLVNSAGQVIGINTAVASAQNIGFAIKINVAKQFIDDFKSSGGKISRPFLGVSYTHISRDVALLNEVPEGELVREVVNGSAADRAGVKVGDIITQFDGQKLTEDNSLSNIIRGKKVGDSVKIRIFRDGKTLDVSATLGEAPTE